MDPLTPHTVVVFRRRWYRVMLMTVLFVVGFAAVKKEPASLGITTGQWLLIGLGLLAVLWVVYRLNWRCPACGEVPSDHLRPRYCGHCGAPLLEGSAGSGAPRMSREEWRSAEAKWDRDREMVWVGKYALGLIVVVIGVFFFGIVAGVGGDAGKGRVAGMGFAVFLLLLGWVFVRWIREGFEAAGLPPERAERGVRGMVGAAALIMIFLGFGGLFYVVSPFDPTQTGWELRLAPVRHAEALAIASGLYLLVGIILLARGLRALRGNRCD